MYYYYYSKFTFPNNINEYNSDWQLVFYSFNILIEQKVGILGLTRWRSGIGSRELVYALAPLSLVGYHGYRFKSTPLAHWLFLCRFCHSCNNTQPTLLGCKWRTHLYKKILLHNIGCCISFIYEAAAPWMVALFVNNFNAHSFHSRLSVISLRFELFTLNLILWCTISIN